LFYCCGDIFFTSKWLVVQVVLYILSSSVEVIAFYVAIFLSVVFFSSAIFMGWLPICGAKANGIWSHFEKKYVDVNKLIILIKATNKIFISNKTLIPTWVSGGYDTISSRGWNVYTEFKNNRIQYNLGHLILIGIPASTNGIYWGVSERFEEIRRVLLHESW
jgi:hypothetical protein